MSGDRFDLVAAQRRIFESTLGPLERLVALAILDHWSRAHAKPYPSVARLEAWTGLSRNAVLNAIRGLERAGAIGVTRGFGISSTYDLGPLMRLPVRDVNRFTGGTGSPDEPVHQKDPTSSPEVPPPVHQKDTKEPREGTKRRNQGSRTGVRKGSTPVQVSLLSEPAEPEPAEPEVASSDHRIVTECYFECFERERGQRPVFRSIEGKAVKDLLTAAGSAERACEFIRRAFASFRRKTVTIQQIAKDPSAFAVEARQGACAPQETPDGARFDDEAERRAEELASRGGATSKASSACRARE
ncbi:MAG TPA: helix-turn-helix domain-containing protein [Polyangiaceae bacterium]|nr:helix-turn-helix domain-containing protein [Polyangiaceae bacterium]